MKPHVCPKCDGDETKSINCFPCGGRGIVWENDNSPAMEIIKSMEKNAAEVMGIWKKWEDYMESQDPKPIYKEPLYGKPIWVIPTGYTVTTNTATIEPSNLPYACSSIR